MRWGRGREREERLEKTGDEGHVRVPQKRGKRKKGRGWFKKETKKRKKKREREDEKIRTRRDELHAVSVRCATPTRANLSIDLSQPPQGPSPAPL